MKVVVLPIRFGETVPSPINARCLNFYRKLAEVFFSDDASSQPAINCNKPQPIISGHALLPDIVASLIGDAVKAVDLDSNVILDVGGPDERELLKSSVLQGLNTAIGQFLQERSDLRIGVFIPVPLEKEDHAATALLATVQDMQVRLVFGNGGQWGRYFEKRRVSAVQVAEYVNEAKTDTVELLKNKIIRRIGHYTLPPSRTAYATYYDGRWATSEIYSLVRDRLLASQAAPAIERILYDTRSSPWFEAPVVSALDATSLRSIASQIGGNTEPSHASGPRTLLLLPIIRTGTTLRKLLGGASGLNPDQLPQVWSLLSTAGEDGDRVVSLSDKNTTTLSIRVQYALEVRATDTWLQKTLNSIKFDGETPFKEDLSEPLLPSAMWTMILESGMTPEDVGPTRTKLGYVPNFEKIADVNGALLAAKFQALLQKKFGSSLPKLTFVCPAERHAEKLAACLRDLAGHSTITIRRPVIDEFARGKRLSDLTSVFSATGGEPEDRIAFDQLNTLSRLNAHLPPADKPGTILLDEFTYFGSTMQGLYRLAKAFRLNVLCGMTIGQFGPEVSVPDKLECLSFYKIDYRNCLSTLAQ